MPTYTGTQNNDSWTVVNPGTFTLDGLGGTDTLLLGTSLRSSYNIIKSSDGAVHVDSVSGASGALHATLNNMERLVFNSGRDVLDLTTYFGSTPAPTPAVQTLVGTSNNDMLTTAPGHEIIDGLAGIDTVVLSQARASYTVARTASGYTITAGDGNGIYDLTNVERVQFSNTKLALDLNGNAGQTAKILGAVFGAPSVANAQFAGIGLQLLDSGMSYANVIQLALDARLGAGAGNAAVVDLLYTNVIGTHPSPADMATFVALLDNHTYTPATLAILAADTSLNQANITLVGLAQTGLPYA